MDRDAALARILNSKVVSTLAGGKRPVCVVNSNEYVSAVAAGAQGPEVLSAVHAALRADPRTAILVGAQGSGKSTALAKLLVDWAQGEALQTFAHVFYFQMADVSSTEGSLSLEGLLQRHHGHIPPESIRGVLQRPQDALFVFDDLHRYGHSLDPSEVALCSDPFRAAPVPCLVAGLLHASLLSGAALVVATRPTGSLRFLSGTTVELLGFLKPQRRVYFNRFFTDPAAADAALTHMERTLGFYDFCASPGFCWTVCCVYKSLMDAGKGLPETLTQLCVHILVHLIQDLSLRMSSLRELVVSLGRVASHCRLHGRSSCTKEEIASFGLQQFLSSLGVFLKADDDLEQHTCVFSFHSQLLLEFILAVSLFLGESTSERVERTLEENEQRAGVVDLFLSGLSEPGQRAPLEALLGDFGSDLVRSFRTCFKSDAEATLRGCCREMHHRCFRRLHQTQNEQWVREVAAAASARGIGYGDMSLRDCVALSYVVSCLGEVKELNLYRTSDLTEQHADALAPALSLSRKIT